MMIYADDKSEYDLYDKYDKAPWGLLHAIWVLTLNLDSLNHPSFYISVNPQDNVYACANETCLSFQIIQIKNGVWHES